MALYDIMSSDADARYSWQIMADFTLEQHLLPAAKEVAAHTRAWVVRVQTVALREVKRAALPN